MPFKMMGKSPLMKKLVGKQGNLPENLKAAIKAAPGKMVSPLKEDKENKATAQRKKAAKIIGSLFGDYGSFIPDSEAARKARGEGNKKASEKSETGKIEGSGAATANQNAGQTFQDLQKKVAGMSQAQKDSIKKAQNKMSGKKKVTPPKVTPPKVTSEVKKPAAATTTTPKTPKVGFSVGAASASFGGKQQGGTKGFSTVKVGGSGGAKATFGKKVVNRGSSFTDEYGNTFERSVKGRKKADGSVSKTISNKTNDVTTREKDVTKGPKVKGKRKAKTVTKTKFDSKGDVRKVVEKTRGQKRKVLSDSEIIKRRENLKADRKKRDESPTKMKTKTPSKMMKKAPSKMMKKAAAPKMMKKAPAKMMKKKKK